MKYAKISEHQWFVRLEKDEELAEMVKTFADSKSIKAGYVQGIGGLQSAKIGVYRLSGSKKYEFTDIAGDLELVSLQGNIARSEGDVMLHAHAVVGNERLETIGGHFDSGLVGGTVELYITTFAAPFERVHNEAVGLKLLEFK